jgi:hypothetical protein
LLSWSTDKTFCVITIKNISRQYLVFNFSNQRTRRREPNRRRQSGFGIRKVILACDPQEKDRKLITEEAGEPTLSCFFQHESDLP